MPLRGGVVNARPRADKERCCGLEKVFIGAERKLGIVTEGASSL